MLSLQFNGLPRLIDEYDLVLLPLLNDLQQERLQTSLGLVAVEEAQLRIVSLLGRLLLQNLHLLPTDPECFRQSLWLPLLHSLCSLHRHSGEPIRESLPETLKNILLVMHTANLIDQVWEHCSELKETMPELIAEMELVVNAVEATAETSEVVETAVEISDLVETIQTMPVSETVVEVTEQAETMEKATGPVAADTTEPVNVEETTEEAGLS